MINKTGVLLDTHIWIWLNNGSSELKTKSIHHINQAAANGEVFIAAISVWEIATLAAKNRITLRTSVHDWINEALNQPGVELLPLTPTIAIESTRLPGELHGDPADRIIAATARLHNLTLMTRDVKLQSYAKLGFIKIMES